MLDFSSIKRREAKMEKDIKLQVITSALYQRSIKNVSKNPNVRLSHEFSHVIPYDVEPLEQHRTGTCWLQAACTFLCMRAKMNGITFKPSIAYLMYYDKLERAVVFLHRITQTNLDDRTKYHLLEEPISDGGSWSMFVFLIKKYGIVPFETYPQTYQAKNTKQLNYILNTYLRNTNVDDIKKNMSLHIEKVHEILTACLSLPPNNIVLTKEKNGVDFNGTPQSLFIRLRIDLNFTCFQHAPTKIEGEKYVIYQSNDHTNMEQHCFHAVNLDVLKKMTVECLELNIPVWFTANVGGGADFSRKLMECNAIDYELLFDIGHTNSKEYLMERRSVKPSHAMLSIGVHCDNGKPVRWKVQNSWGKKTAFLTMSEKWFNNNVFEIAIPFDISHKFVSHKPPIHLAPWDILSTVAM